MAQEIGVAYVSLVPSARGWSKAVENETSGAFDGAEKKSNGFFGKLAKGAVGVVAGAVAAIGAVTVGKGIARALNIEDAQAKLKGLGHDTQAITSIMDDALASVKGTAFGLDTAATLAASAVAAGIKPGRDLERYLRLTADAATIAGGSMDDLGRVMNNVTTLGAAYNDSLQILAQKGLPIYDWLAEKMGVTTAEVKKLASEGKISAEVFREAIEENIAGAALTAGDTTRGAFANMMAAFGRLGAMFAGPGLEAAKNFFGEITELTDGIGERIKPLTDKFGTILSGIDMSNMAESILGFFDTFDIGALITSGMQGRTNLIQAGLGIAQSLLDGLIAAIPQIVEGAASMVTSILEMIIAYGPSLLTAAVELFTGLVQGVITILPTLIETIVGLVPVIAQTLLVLVPELLTAAVELFNSLVAAIPVIIPMLVDAIVNLLPVLVQTILTLIPQLIQGAINLFMAIVNAIPVILPALIQGIIKLLPVIINSVISLIPALIDGAVQLFTALVRAIPVIVPQLIDAIATLGPQMINTILGIVPQLFNAGKAIIRGLIDGVKSMFGAVGDAFGGMMDFVGGFFPRSPAKRGPFSGAGWTALRNSGRAILDEFDAGLQDRTINLGFGTLPQTLTGMSNTTTPISVSGPSNLTVVDADGALIGRMRVEVQQHSTEVASGIRSRRRMDA